MFRIMRHKLLYYLATVTALVIIWRLFVLETKSHNLDIVRKLLEVQKDQLHLAQQQLLLLQSVFTKEKTVGIPIIYAITPTYYRHVQEAELTRIIQVLQLAHNIHWIVIEDSDVKTELVRSLIAESNLTVTHLNVKTEPFQKLKAKEPRWKRHRGIEQRNAALVWLRENKVVGKDKGIIYFMDDDNTYNVKIFSEMIKIKKVGVWPVGFTAGYNVESPIVDKITGKVKGYLSGWKPNRPFAIDMAGFAINLDLILLHPNVKFSYEMEIGFQESEFLGKITTRDDLEPLADNCTKVYVWHTRTLSPDIKPEL